MAVISKTDRIKDLIGFEFRLVCFCLSKLDTLVSNEMKLGNTVYTYKKMVCGAENVGTIQGPGRQ